MHIMTKEVEQVKSYYKSVKEAQRHGHDCVNMDMNNIPLQKYEEKKTDLKTKFRKVIYYIVGCRLG